MFANDSEYVNTLLQITDTTSTKDLEKAAKALFTDKYTTLEWPSVCYLNPRMTERLLGSDSVTRVQLQHPLNQVFGIVRDVFPLLALHLQSK